MLTFTVFGNSFSAEGEYDHVTTQFERWLKALRIAERSLNLNAATANDIVAAAESDVKRSAADASLDKLFEENGEALRLLTVPDGESATLNGVLTILLGFLAVKGVREVTGGRIMQSMEFSGLPVERVDKIVDPVRDLINPSGVRRAKKYSLTTKGLTAARAVAQTLLEKIPS